MRPKALLRLLNSVENQTLYPNEIIIVDGSVDKVSKAILEENHFKNLSYFLVEENDRGLTRQRNFGISKVCENSEIVCFLDDDTVLNQNYFQELMSIFRDRKDITGVGGIALNENRWKEKELGQIYNPLNYYELDDFVYPEGLRNKVRNYLGLNSYLPSNCMPEFSHGRTSGYPINGKIYEVDLLIGMSMSFRQNVFNHINFSSYFEGYGLYEDADFSIRAQRYGKNVIGTKVQLQHFHDPSGRPNTFKYGKMVIRNGWYVWRLKYPKPSLKSGFKWHAVHFVLMCIRFINVLTTKKSKEAFLDGLGRFVGWWQLLFDKPKVES